MKFLLDLPLVMWVANSIWGEDPEVTPDLCIELFPWMNGPCWSTFLVKSIGIAIILGACMNKVPVISNILSSRSTEGISRGSVYGEELMYMNSGSYGLLEGHPLTAYGENGALAIQNLVIMLMSWNFGAPKVSAMERGLVIACGLLYLVGVTSFLTPEFHYLLMTANWPILIYSKGSQIYTTLQVKHMGSQSIITIGMNVLGASLRFITTLKEVGFDLPVLSGIVIGLSLSLISLGQFFYYRKNTEEFYREMEAKKKA